MREFVPKHPSADSNGYVFQHRLVAEIQLGRFLHQGEEVHHRDHNRSNNAPNNLVVFPDRKSHMRAHRAKRADPAVIEAVRKAAADPDVSIDSVPGVSKGTVRAILKDYGMVWVAAGRVSLSEDEVRRALETHSSVAKAAASLGTCYMTIERRFPALARQHKRSRPGFLDPHREAVCSIAIQQGIPKTAIKFATSRTVIMTYLRKWKADGGLPTELVERLDRLDQKRERMESVLERTHD